MNTTDNYQFNQWDGADRILREDFNADNRKTEEALTELAQNCANLEAAVALCGNCRMVAFSYTGTGSTTSTVEFTERPVLFIIQGGSGLIVGGQGKSATAAASGASITSTQVSKLAMTWSGGVLTLKDSSPYWVLNASNVVYQVIAFYLAS